MIFALSLLRIHVIISKDHLISLIVASVQQYASLEMTHSAGIFDHTLSYYYCLPFIVLS